MEEKIPCIRCNSQLWNYVKPYLKEWGYNSNNISFNDDSKDYPLLVINYTGKLGKCYTLPLYYKDGYDRILVTDVEEFLEKAAILKGFIYKKPVLIHGIEIKPGMVLVTKSNIVYVAFPMYNKMAFANIEYGGWRDDIPHDIIQIRDLVEGDSITNGKLLWDGRKIVITLDEVAEKFGCSVDQIEIKK